MSIIEKLTAWSYVVLLCTIGGLVLGMACDRLLWESSYDYVFPIHACRNSGLKLGCLLGTIIAAGTTISSYPALSWQWTTVAWMSAMVATAGIAVGSAAIAWALAKAGWLNPTGDEMTPLSRMVFCSELVRGANLGAWISAITWTAIAWRKRLQMQRCAVTTNE
ncbi:MAG: hypothetical protein Q8K78_06040 [Planctomycetaceae bacterium]|nr:hypothetical protein [Planctomycetaceae bacterium]